MSPAPTKLTARVKRLLVEHGLPYSARLDEINRLALLDKWRKRNGRIPYFASRDAMYSHLIEELEGPITYLEFGVWKGVSMRFWSRHHHHPESRFFGFDTFTGLPEDWGTLHGTLSAGSYSAEGRLPDIPDPRVSFIRGLFQDTLPHFLEGHRLHGQLVVNSDSDLLSSTLYTLCTLHPILSGAIVIFDEFSRMLDEFLALDLYVSAYRRQYNVLAASGQYYDRVAIQFH